MTKSKVILQNGNVVRIRLHPSKGELLNQTIATCSYRMRAVKSRGGMLQNRSW